MSDTRYTFSGCRSCRRADIAVDDVGSVAAVFAYVALPKGASWHCSFPCYGSSSVMKEVESVGQPTVCVSQLTEAMPQWFTSLQTVPATTTRSLTSKDTSSSVIGAATAAGLGSV